MRLKIAIQKSGRLSDKSLDLLNKCGLEYTRSKNSLFCYGRNLPIDLLLMRNDDIPKLLLGGVCDLGIVGENIETEYSLEPVYNGEEAERHSLSKLRSLGFGQCRLSLAGPKETEFRNVEQLEGSRIATSYPNTTREFFKRQGVGVKVTELAGSVEIAPGLGIADYIVDLVSTGSTLEANKLDEWAVILESRAALYQPNSPLNSEKQALLDRLLQRLDGVLQARESKYVMLHAPKDHIQAITDLLPGVDTPTVLPLQGSDDRVAVHAVCTESVFWEHLESLKEAGASSILVLPVEKMLA